MVQRQGILALLVAVAAALAVAEAAPPPSELPAIPGGAGGGDEPKGGGGENTVPSLPVEWQAMSCELHLDGVGFGGVQAACEAPHHHHHHHRHHHHRPDRRLRCCPVLATWLYAAQAGAALQAVQAQAPSSSAAQMQQQQQVEMPVPPDDSAVCAAQLEEGLSARGLNFPPVNSSCDFSLCFCGIRLRQIASLGCPVPYFGFRNESSELLLPTSTAPFLHRLQSACARPNHDGCTACIQALDNAMDWGEEKTASSRLSVKSDCRLMGLMWLLAKNSSRYAATASAVIRATVYNEQAECSSDDSAMPLADGFTTTLEMDASSSPASAMPPLLPPLALLLAFLARFV